MFPGDFPAALLKSGRHFSESFQFRATGYEKGEFNHEAKEGHEERNAQHTAPRHNSSG